MPIYSLVEEMTTGPRIEDFDQSTTNQELILGLTLDEDIIQFNKDIESLTGYHRDEVLHKKLELILLPADSIAVWKKLLVSIRQTMWIDEFILPLKTKQNQTCIVNWTGFFIKDEHGSSKNICLIGKPIKTDMVKKQSLDISPAVPEKYLERKNEVVIPESVVKPQGGTKGISSDVPAMVLKEPLERKVQVPVSESMVKPPENQLVKSSDVPVVISEKPLERKTEVVVPESLLISQDNKRGKSSVIPPLVSEKPRGQKSEEVVPESVLKSLNSEMPIKHGRNKIIFAKGERSDSEQLDKIVRDPLVKPKAAKRKKDDASREKHHPMNESYQDGTGRYDVIMKRLGDMETKDRPLGKEHAILESHTQHRNERSIQPEKKQKKSKINEMQSHEEQEEKRDVSFFSDPFGFKRQHRELDERKRQLDIRSTELDALQSYLQKEQNSLNIRIGELSKWREKLELLESAIEKRRQELMKQEDSLLEKSIPVCVQRTVPTELVPPRHSEPVVPEHDETLEKIPQSAAIIQRGILKQINDPFLKMLGYPTEEIIEKSFFDFIALEGLADIEKYYLDRLKGDNVSVYKTVFTTKDYKKISAEVSIKQTIYNGEKAEIVIITLLTMSTS
jgi:PAS domain S-box-containing protein